ncbi:molybdenum ABC transporter ATP-binding protein [Litorisediminicola beolgyonensis]|uniref:Molybdenum ABC transporter ATP-binding protein n=1 Tax=Litorisediminicola beolgyonensis TaxID=1173614 RepID=A0ABW3ZP25_9RHOB
MTLSVALRHDFPDTALDIAFEAPSGVTVLFGRSGAGKSSVIQAIAGLLAPDAGRIALGPRVLLDTEARICVPVHRRRLGLVFQDARLFPHLSVRQNLIYARRGRGRLDETAALLGLEALLDRRPGTLSGGEAQRVAIGRALLSEPEMLLMDEPLAALDGARKAEILPYLERLCAEAGVPILYVSHNIAEVARLARHIVLIDGGRVLKAGPSEALLSDPDLVHVIGLREAGSVMQARVRAQSGDGLTELEVSGGTLWLPQIDAAPGVSLRIRILAQDVLLASRRPEGLSALNVLPATVIAMRRGSGPGVVAQLRVGSDTLLARVTRRSAEALGLEPGAPCFAVLKSVAVSPADIGLAGPERL